MAATDNPGISLDPWLLVEVFGEPILATVNGTVLSVSIQPGDQDAPAVGDILNAVIDLVEPGRVLDLDPPWDALTSFQLPHVTFKMDFGTARSLEFDITPTGLSIGPASLSSINFQYLPATGAKKGSQKKQFLCSVEGLLGTLPLKELSWNMMRQPAPDPVPAIPATPPIFQLDYLAFGQRVSLTSPAPTFDGVIDALKGTPPADDISPLPSTALQFDAGASWLAATEFSVMGAVTLGIVFNDPALYGAKISLSGPKVKILSGLSFEILYRSIADGLGLYHIELKLPDQFRRFDIGAATITLPVIDLDIYTDGSFLFDFGFPYNHDYSQSATLEMIVLGIPVLGAGGFYFGVLDRQAVPNLPLLKGTGIFSPVIVFGLGLKIGLAKSLDEGILQAGFELAIEGIIEGVLAFYESSDKSVTDTYYKVSGLIALVGHLYGSIDFVVIKARVDLMVYASVQFVYEAYQGAVITMEADVSVQVSLDVDLGVFSFSVQFSFAAHVEADFTIDVADDHKWVAAP